MSQSSSFQIWNKVVTFSCITYLETNLVPAVASFATKLNSVPQTGHHTPTSTMSDPNPQIILFTYPESVYGRRLDWYLTLRNIKYTHCRVLNRLPRPVLEALNVNYRRIPICAIGRDFYCDTRIIIEKCEALIAENRLGATAPYQKGSRSCWRRGRLMAGRSGARRS